MPLASPLSFASLVQAALNQEADLIIKQYVRNVAIGIQRDLRAESPVKSGKLKRGWRVTAQIFPWRGQGRQLIGILYIRNRVFYAVPAAARVDLIGRVLAKWGAAPNGGVYGG